MPLNEQHLTQTEFIAIGDIIASHGTDPTEDLSWSVVEERLSEYFTPDELSGLQAVLLQASGPEAKRRIINGALFMKEVRISEATKKAFEEIIA